MHNPYQTPSAALRTAAGGAARQLGEPARCNAGRGIDWLSEGWQLFLRAPGMLLGMSVLLLVLYGLVSLIPLVGSLASLLFWPALAAGLFLALRHADEGRPVTFADLFEPFANLAGLITLGACYLLALLLPLVIVFGTLVAAGLLAAMAEGSASHMDAMMSMMPAFLLAALLLAALLTLVAMGFVFAPILVHQQQVPAIEAIRLSFVACLRNWLPFLLWGLALLLGFGLVSLLSIIPFVGPLLLLAAGLLLMPLSAASLYCAYRDIFWH